MIDINATWTLENIPPEGHKDVADFAFNLFEIARIEKERLNKPAEFLSNYALYRGKKSTSGGSALRNNTLVNLYFANIERTISNITARNPVGEVTVEDGIKDGAEEIFAVKLKKWWKDTNQQNKARFSARTMEIYGIVSEKPYWDKEKKIPNIMITDPFSLFPAPGVWDDLSTEPPYICFAYLDFKDKVEKEYDVTGVSQEEAYDLLGTEREKYRADSYNPRQQRTGNYSDPMTRVGGTDKTTSDKKVERCLILEIWVRDKREKTIKEKNPVFDEEGIPILDENNELVIEETTRKELVYPDGVRKILITKGESGKKTRSEYMVLDDSANPNINPLLEKEFAEKTYPWGRFPIYYVNSYKDLVSIWGFSAAEQVGDLISKINKIITRLISYVLNVMTPPLIIQNGCGVTNDMIENQLGKEGRLILRPYFANARIEYMKIPDLPATFFQVLDIIIKLFDRVYQIEDADRGQAPRGITAASAIVALQERNQVLMQAKTSAIDFLAEQKNKWAIGLLQNFGTLSELIEVNEEPVEFVGTQYAGRVFSYVVEAGSTAPRTSLQIQELAGELYKLNAIDRRALLESINFKDWPQIIERMGENDLDQALQILIDAGLPEEQAIQLKQFLIQPQGGPGDTNQNNLSGAGAPSGGKGSPRADAAD
jgi:hypothetical protein